MDVDSFIARHQDEWNRLERASARGPRALAREGGAAIDEVVRGYLRVSGHLAEARTHLRDRDLEAYLSRVVATAHGAIYGARPRTRGDLVAAFGSRYRAALATMRPFLWVAAVVLLGLTTAIAIWTWQSPAAQAGLVPGYAEALAEPSGDLRSASAGLSTAIFLNNVRVAVLAFALGITLGAGTIWILAVNAVHIGGIAGVAIAVGGGERFFALVLPHGFLELLAIVVAAAAGLRMGWSVVEPGDLPRVEALAQASRDAVTVVVGVVPAFLAAGAIEGLLTGVTGQPALEILFGAVVAAVYGWFVLRLPSGTDTGDEEAAHSAPERLTST